MFYGIVPEKEILLQCNSKSYDEIENPREYFAKIAQKLEKIRDDSSMHQILGDLIVVLVPYIENCITINSFFRDIFRLYGQIWRQEESHFPPFNIVLSISGVGIQQLEVHWCTKVKKIRERVSVMLKQEAVIMLMYRGQSLDDDEYLISYGCRSGTRNDIKARATWKLEKVQT